ncbi:MAG: ABC transporter permease [Steroidobacteraceae bacterium]|jgi:putative ABC transport system permease protein|nr:ABC transporter permease [Steroidobacteraceae bacterium]
MITRYLPLLWANLMRKRLRTSLTLASIVIAFLLFGLLQALRLALTGTPELAGVDRLITIHKVSIIQSLPRSYLTRIRGVDGVKVATSLDWFGGIYQDDRNQIGSFPVEVETFFDVYPEYQLPPEQRAAWESDRTAAIVGQALMERFGWQVGDVIPLRSNIWRKQDGGNVWDLRIAGVYSAENGDNSGLYFHYDYFNESRTADRDRIGWVALRVEDPDRAAQIAARIDEMFANSSTETKTTTEKAFVQGFANQLGNIGALLTAIAAAVFFTMLLVTANTMGQSIRERISEIGVMKTLGFSAFNVTSLVLAEAMLVTLLGAAIGLTLASLAVDALAQAVQQYFPLLGLPNSTYALGAALAIGLGAAAAALPCAQAWRLKIVEALRK